MRIAFLATLAAALGLVALPAPSALAFPTFWTNAARTTRLRDVKTAPANYPDILEFANHGPVTFSATMAGGPITVACNQVELSTSVIINNGSEETILSLPFGIFEGDECGGPGGASVPTRFRAMPPGAGTGVIGISPSTATITVTGSSTPYPATLHHVTVWQTVAGTVCAWNLDQIHGAFENTTEGFVEDAPPNLTIRFPAVAVPITNPKHSQGCPGTGTFGAELFLETVSTSTDTAFVG